MKSKERKEIYFDKTVNSNEIDINDELLLKFDRTKKKSESFYEGPFEVIDVNRNTKNITILYKGKRYVVHSDRLRLAIFQFKFLYMLKLLLFAMLAGVKSQNIVLSTRAYDFGIKKQNDMDIATYSLVDTQQCENKRKNIIMTTPYGQIVQKNKITEIVVTQCKVKLHRTVQRCSWWSYLDPVENEEQEYLIDIFREQCKKVHDTGSFEYSTDKIMTDIKVSTTRSIYLASDAIDN